MKDEHALRLARLDLARDLARAEQEQTEMGKLRVAVARNPRLLRTDADAFCRYHGGGRYTRTWDMLATLTPLVPAAFWPALLIPDGDFESDDQLPEDAKGFLRGYTSGEGELSALIVGDVGTGKTWLSVRLLRHLIEIFTEETGEYRMARPRFDVNVITEDEFVRRRRPQGDIDEVVLQHQYQRPALLLLDDIGMSKMSEFTEQELFGLVNARLTATTLFTTNLDFDDLADRLGNRTSDRIRGVSHPIVLTGDSRR